MARIDISLYGKCVGSQSTPRVMRRGNVAELKPCPFALCDGEAELDEDTNAIHCIKDRKSVV